MSHRGKPWGEGKEAAKHPEEVVTLERRRSPGCDVERPALLGPGTLGFTRSTADQTHTGEAAPRACEDRLAYKSMDGTATHPLHEPKV